MVRPQLRRKSSAASRAAGILASIGYAQRAATADSIVVQETERGRRWAPASKSALVIARLVFAADAATTVAPSAITTLVDEPRDRRLI